MSTAKYIIIPLAKGLLLSSLACLPNASFSNTLRERVGVVLLTKGISAAYEQPQSSHKINYRTLQRNSTIYKNDYIQTNIDGKIRIRFANGVTADLAPNKIFNVKAYMDKQKDGGPNVVKVFLKNSFRNITGIVSNISSNQDIHATPADSIGIR